MSLIEQGNKYVITQTSTGIYSFKHLATNEILHGQVGPWQEANLLYVDHSGIKESQSDLFVVYDIGMGCGSQLFAMYEAFIKNNNIKKLCVVSFDLEKNGLLSLKENISYFPYLSDYTDLLNLLILNDKVMIHTADHREFEWIFIKGDFSQLIPEIFNSLPNADVVCYDFFSPAKHPHLWTYQLFAKLYIKSNLEVKLITYTSATAVRAALLAAGFFVGFGPISGKKAKSTIATKKKSNLTDPLPEVWKQTFTASCAKFSEKESEIDKNIIASKINQHTQW